MLKDLIDKDEDIEKLKARRQQLERELNLRERNL
jgi:hypothetical protein